MKIYMGFLKKTFDILLGILLLLTYFKSPFVRVVYNLNEMVRVGLGRYRFSVEPGLGDEVCSHLSIQVDRYTRHL